MFIQPIHNPFGEISYTNSWSLRKNPNTGIFYACNDGLIAFNPHPVVARNLTEQQANKVADDYNKGV